MNDQPLSEEREHVFRSLANGGPYSEMLAEIDRLRAEVATWRQRAEQAENGQRVASEVGLKWQTRADELGAEVARLEAALAEIIRVEGHENTAWIAEQALRSGGREQQP